MLLRWFEAPLGRGVRRGRQAPTEALLLLARIEHCAVLVAFVQSVIGPFHEDFRPFHQRGGEETGKGADEDFLEECGVHPFFESSDGASNDTLCKLPRLKINTARPWRAETSPKAAAR